MVTRAPTSSLALASLHELDRLCEIFQRCSDRAPTAANHVDIVRKLHRQAHDAFAARAAGQQQQQQPQPQQQPARTSPAACAELYQLGGRMHLIAPDSAGVVHSVPSPTWSSSSGSISGGNGGICSIKVWGALRGPEDEQEQGDMRAIATQHAARRETGLFRFCTNTF
ncbi:uncharacterized protein PHACADRAFT_206418 [Phanerochaete carnosa HHB-10118-sp]|uniref:Uncharacterized protein n=1 Tax=Phanerochaete carnosa (strain HHB-10118-sp) TaxID=650164 RepID=K5WEM3_PHACS|nr:uncharacterized protein PHACADRAFT_206418 [Phanerochaete carnosa HHB-10118-sp]EKM57519.1 hypothetical protein PHACADRAFT_206418 [Phanerochaete carnosa HHB-10118-sp]